MNNISNVLLNTQRNAQQCTTLTKEVMKMTTANKNAGVCVSNWERFTGSNTFAQHESGCYVVYSYGKHYPMYIYKDKVWYENKDKYSQSTSKQKTQLRPSKVNEFVLKSTEEMKELLNGR